MAGSNLPSARGTRRSWPTRPLGHSSMPRCAKVFGTAPPAAAGTTWPGSGIGTSTWRQSPVCPVNLWYGEEDHGGARPALGQWLHEHSPTSKLTLRPGEGHFGIFDH